MYVGGFCRLSVSGGVCVCVKGRSFVLIGCVCELARSVMMLAGVRRLSSVFCFNDELKHNSFKAHVSTHTTQNDGQRSVDVPFRCRAVIPLYDLRKRSRQMIHVHGVFHSREITCFYMRSKIPDVWFKTRKYCYEIQYMWTVRSTETETETGLDRYVMLGARWLTEY